MAKPEAKDVKVNHRGEAIQEYPKWADGKIVQNEKEEKALTGEQSAEGEDKKAPGWGKK